MYEYHLNVLLDDGNKQKLYVVQSADEIPKRILQLAGLLLDQGLFSSEEVAEHAPLAESYVEVRRLSPPEPEDYCPCAVCETETPISQMLRPSRMTDDLVCSEACAEAWDEGKHR